MLRSRSSKINDSKFSASIKYLESQLQGLIKETQLDTLLREWNKLKIDKSSFDGNYDKYMADIRGKKNCYQCTHLVWGHIIENEDFPILSVFLKAILCLFHGTASVEGSVNHARNTLGPGQEITAMGNEIAGQLYYLLRRLGSLLVPRRLEINILYDRPSILGKLKILLAKVVSTCTERRQPDPRCHVVVYCTVAQSGLTQGTW